MLLVSIGCASGPLNCELRIVSEGTTTRDQMVIRNRNVDELDRGFDPITIADGW